MSLFGPPDVGRLERAGHVKGLVKALGYRKDPAVRRDAARALGRIGDARSAQPLVGALTDADRFVREAAAVALGAIGDPAAMEPLIRALDDGSPAVRAVSARSLGTIGHGQAVEPLKASLSDADPRVRCAAAEALGKLGDSRVAASLLAALQDGAWEVRRATAEALEALGWTPDNHAAGARYWAAKEQWNRCIRIGRPAAEPLAAALGDTRLEKGARQAAVQALIQIGVPSVEPLVSALVYRAGDTRRMAAQALGEIGDVRAVEPLVAALRDSDPDVRQAATVALGKLGDSRAIVPLLRQLRSGQYRWSQPAAEALVRFGAPAVEPLVAALSDPKAPMRPRLADLLGRIGDPRAVEPLVHLLDEDRSDTAAAAAAALGAIGDPRAIAPLARALERCADPVRWQQQMRQAAVEALGKIGDARAVPSLIIALGDENGAVRKAAADALANLADARAIEPLAALLHDRGHAVRAAAAEALDHLGWEPHSDETGAAYWAAKYEWDRCAAMGPLAVGPLIAILLDASSGAQEQAAEMLARIGDPRAVAPAIELLKAHQWHSRRLAASLLLRLYHSSGLGQEHKERILAQRGSITKGHVDYRSSSDCGHTDHGIGVAFTV